MSVTNKILEDYCSTLLSCRSFNDYAPNGLQIQGKKNINSICTAVTASLDIIKAAVSIQADALLVHHGYFWSNEPREITGLKQARIKALLSANINLLAYHLPLDCHETLGNNAALGQLLQIKSLQKHTVGKISNLLWTGQLSHALTMDALMTVLTQKFSRVPQVVQGHDRPIHSVAWCSGAAQDYLYDAYQLGVDAYISGEISERTYYEAQELGIHYFACGHHATERYGIQALGEHIAQQFSLKHLFIDSANPI